MNSLESLVTSFDSLWSNYFAIMDLGANKMHAMKFNNNVNKPLVTGPEEPKIVGKLVFFPEHRVFTIIIGRLARSWSGRSSTWPISASTSWTSGWHCLVLRNSTNILFYSPDHKDSKKKHTILFYCL